MTRISDTFARCRAENRAAFIPFIMAGDPSAEKTLEILNALPAAGADIIELGIPFSDPMADGPVIQEAGLRALKGGMSLSLTLKLAGQFRAAHPAVPLVLMGYVNPIYRYLSSLRTQGSPSEGDSRFRVNDNSKNGYAAFARDAQDVGVDGIIIVDAPPEEAAEIEPLLSAHHIDFVRLIAPTSVPDRLPLLVKNASGYLYYISITGITGAASAAPKQIAEKIVTIRQHTDLPVCVGFGVKTPEDVKALAGLADGVVVGSALVKMMHDTGGDVGKVSTFVRTLADGCKR